MSPRNALRIAVVAEWAFIVVEQDLKTLELAVLVIMVPMMLVLLVSSFGLFFLKNWARWLYLWTTIASYIVLPYLGPTVEHGLVGAVDDLSVLLSGAILGIAFFGNVIPVPERKVTKISDTHG
jgi:hypothetical protein